MTIAALVYPFQLFRENPALTGCSRVFLVEDPLLFSQYAFHRKKLMLHRASMKAYAHSLAASGTAADYVEAHSLHDSGAIADVLTQSGVRAVRTAELCDDWLERRLRSSLDRANIELKICESPGFLTPQEKLDRYLPDQQQLLFADFYRWQRRRLAILTEPNGSPAGGKWSFDADNRKRLPRGHRPPDPWRPAENEWVREARDYVRQNFPDAHGSDEDFEYPVTFADAERSMEDFFRHRFDLFGIYEDAVSATHRTIYHSLLTPPLNIGLLTPAQVVAAALRESSSIPLNSLEGFIRQVIGWREYMRLVYLRFGRRMRTSNDWGFTSALPKTFYTGETGIVPVDATIKRLQQHAYCHHIERLMLLGNLMLLCRIHPNAVYRWFMELFIDAYDWVMVPNIYGMSQYADGGSIVTKPYISGSAYVLKMSDYPKGAWTEKWDALYWTFIDDHRERLAENQRMSMMVAMCGKLEAKLPVHRQRAQEFLAHLA